MVGPGEGQQEQQRAAGGRQTAQLVGQLNADDLRELQRLVQLLKRMQASVGLEPLPQAVQRVLHESGLVAWLQQQQGEQQEEEEQGEQEQQQSGASPSSEAAAEGLPLPLRCVLLKAQQLAADWERQQQQQAAQTQQIQQPLAGQQVQTQQQLDTEQGVALVQELLSRLAAETAAVSLAEQIQEAQAAQQQQRGPGVLTISTIHVAKGLEWPRVLLPTVSEGFLPVQFRPAPALMADWQAAAAGQEEAQYWSCKRAHEEEERRLFHVAATRARDGLLVSYVLPPAPVPGGQGGGGEVAAATLESLCGTNCPFLLA
jgi:superfamily I DNA/RNA helicase